MNYEEKRELRLQISQLLADAGLNQKVIKDIVEEEIRNKVDRAIEQTLSSLNARSETGDYIYDRVHDYIKRQWKSNYAIIEAVRNELSNKIIQVVLKDVEVEGTKCE